MATWIIEVMNPEIETTWRRVGVAYKSEKDAEADMAFMRDRNPGIKYRVRDTDRRGTVHDRPETDGPYWYQTQERAFAPGVGDGWPEIVPAPHTKNARLKRRPGDPEAAFAACKIALDRLVRLHGICPGDKAQDALRAALEGRQ